MRKMIMKKAVRSVGACLLAVGMTVSMSACSGNSNTATSTDGNALTTGAVNETSGSTEDLIDLDKYMVNIMEVNYKDYIKADAIKDIVIKESDITPSDALIKYTIMSTAMSTLGSKEVTRKVEAGDTVVIDYKGYINDVAFQGGTATDAELGIGSETFIPGFEEGLIGAEIGKEVALNLTFPEDYGNEDYAGKDTVFKVTVKKIKVLADVEDKDVLEKTGHETLEKYKKAIEDDLRKDYRESRLWEIFYDAAELIQDHEGLIDEYVMMNLSMMDGYAQLYGVTRAVFLKEQYGLNSDEEFKNYVLSYAKMYAKQKLVVLAIADIKGFDITEEEYNQKIEELAEEYTVSAEEIKEEYTESDIRFDIIYNKVFDFLYSIEPVEG